MSDRDTTVTEPAGDDEPGVELAGASGDDVSAGTSVSGVGGEALQTEDRDAGLAPVDEQGARIGWGRDAAETDVTPPAGNDGTGQSGRAPA
jgi:hypothetical protein